MSHSKISYLNTLIYGLRYCKDEIELRDNISNYKILQMYIIKYSILCNAYNKTVVTSSVCTLLSYLRANRGSKPKYWYQLHYTRNILTIPPRKIGSSVYCCRTIRSQKRANCDLQKSAALISFIFGLKWFLFLLFYLSIKQYGSLF
jgi:hypothetical protein